MADTHKKTLAQWAAKLRKAFKKVGFAIDPFEDRVDNDQMLVICETVAPSSKGTYCPL
jgi:hypothetical protein